MWKLINSLTSSKEKSSCSPEKLFDPIKSNYKRNPKVMSNIFNTYFVSIGQQLAARFLPQFTIDIQYKLMALKFNLCYMILLLRR